METTIQRGAASARKVTYDWISNTTEASPQTDKHVRTVPLSLVITGACVAIDGKDEARNSTERGRSTGRARGAGTRGGRPHVPERLHSPAANGGRRIAR